MSTPIFPYEFSPNDISLKLTFPGNAAKHTADLVWSFEGKDIPDPLRFKIEAKLPKDWKSLLPNAERKSPAVDIFCVVTCGKTRTSTTIKLSGSGAAHKADFKGASRSLAGVLRISCFLVRGKDAGSVSTMHAAFKGAILATSEDAEIILQPDDKKKGGDLRTEWKSFNDIGKPASNYMNAIYYLDTKKNPPVLYMNDDLDDDLKRVLDTEKTKGKQALIRDAFMMPIVSDVWEQLTTQALRNLDGDDSLDVLEEWEKGVIQAIARDLTRASSQEDAEAKIIEICKEEGAKIEMIDRILPLCVQERSRLSSYLMKAVKGAKL